ncbi:hypothetical protein WDW86_00450 [Bdellovibrionota bacterium FG-2]
MAHMDGPELNRLKAEHQRLEAERETTLGQLEKEQGFWIGGDAITRTLGETRAKKEALLAELHKQFAIEEKELQNQFAKETQVHQGEIPHLLAAKRKSLEDKQRTLAALQIEIEELQDARNKTVEEFNGQPNLSPADQSTSKPQRKRVPSTVKKPSPAEAEAEIEADQEDTLNSSPRVIRKSGP